MLEYMMARDSTMTSKIRDFRNSQTPGNASKQLVGKKKDEKETNKKANIESSSSSESDSSVNY